MQGAQNHNVVGSLLCPAYVQAAGDPGETLA